MPCFCRLELPLRTYGLIKTLIFLMKIIGFLTPPSMGVTLQCLSGIQTSCHHGMTTYHYQPLCGIVQQTL